MNDAYILSHVDHTLLKATSSWSEIQRICDEMVKYGTASVCVPPSYIARVKEKYKNQINICTVIGFPLGYNTTAAKVFEVKEAIVGGASEVDMVVNLGDVKNGDFDRVTAEIKALKEAAGNHVLKVIVEACYLSDEEKARLCKCVTDAGADYIKTSTGFGMGGATIEDVRLFKANIGPDVKIKAAGGIRSRGDMVAFLEAGCERLGTSSAIAILSGGESRGY